MSDLRDPTAGCRDGYRFVCGLGCGSRWISTDFADIARRAARHFNAEHGDDLQRRHDPIETIERGGHHIHGNMYEVERVTVYLTPFDMAENVGQEGGWLAPSESDRVCSSCHCIIPDSDERIPDAPDAAFDNTWTCSQCNHEAEIERRETENEQITEWCA